MFGKNDVITLGLLDYSWVYFDDGLVYGPKRPFLLSYGSCDMRRVDISAS